ncbi:hypothetical protein FGADI_10222 [Fusarium gaditjirri]|uniref:Uncharacterized protein n=1 Tax=Fusarium gaditjirri TaxID=282569 RepID=A0A8H4SXQ2_9HYPO|nr:hypothetical protein FGADI_10222 [Fusarium gaditjirri]
MADQATSTPAKWESLKNYEATADAVAELMIRVVHKGRDEAGSFPEVREFHEFHEFHEFREMTAEKLGNAPPHELAFIVGQCMPDNVKDCVEEYRSKWPIAPSVDEFDEGRHKHVRHRSTGLVVFWLADVEKSQTWLFTLRNRRDSLGTIAPVSNFQRNMDKFAFCSEFIVHPNTTAKTQTPMIKGTIRHAARAAKARLELDEPQSVLNASALATKDPNDPRIKAKYSSLS